MDRSYADIFQDLLLRVEKPARYVAGEQGGPADTQPRPEQVRVALVACPALAALVAARSRPAPAATS